MIVFFEIVLGLIIVVGLIYGISIAIVLGYDKVVAVTRKYKQAQIEAARVPTWEEEFVRNLRSAHYVTKIETAKVVFIFHKDPRNSKDGFQWTCNCGAKDSSLTLELAEICYQKHLKEEAERAAASIGKFKLPAEINWSFDPEGK